MINDLESRSEATTKSQPDFRDQNQEVIRRAFAGRPEVRALLDNAPLPTCILNDQRETLLANEPARALQSQGTDVRGKARPGDFFGCIYAKLKGGCGHTPYCAYCGMNKLLAECSADRHVEGECTILMENGLKLDLKLWARNFTVQHRDYTALTIEDQSREKQRLMLESIFFHDVLNTASGLQWSADFLDDELTDADRQMMQSTITELSRRLIEEITSQRDYVLAERGEYITNKENIALSDCLGRWTHVYQQQLATAGCQLAVQVSPANATIRTDAHLLRRVLINLLKNATEAALSGETVRLSAVQDSKGSVTFTVNNAAVMSERVRLHLFRHQISTKGQRRGYGVESARLLTEQYLQGRLSFVSEPGVGTIFTVVLPPVSERRNAAWTHLER